MGSSFFPLILITTLIALASLEIREAQGTKSSHIIDLLIRDYTFKSYDTHFRTGIIHTVSLPTNFSGIEVESARFRCGSLRRYGARVKEFNLRIGVIVLPCVERVMLIRQNLGHNWSCLFYSNYDLSGYQLVSPVLGLLAYNAGSDVNSTVPFELGIRALEKPMTIDFNNLTSTNTTTKVSNNVSSILCASFDRDGKVELKTPVSQNICEARTNGHYGLVIKSPPSPSPTVAKKKISLWRVVVGTTVGFALGLFLLGLLLVAMIVKVKKKAKREEMETRAYEEEALQVSMVGHVIRAPTAPVTRTQPSIEHHYSAFGS